VGAGAQLGSDASVFIHPWQFVAPITSPPNLLPARVRKRKGST
jgi:hypothetical protein